MKIDLQEKIVEILGNIINNRKFKDGLSKIVLKCPASKDGEHKLLDAFWNVYYIIHNYYPVTSEKYTVVGTENGAYDEPSDYIDFDDLGAFYADIVNALDIDGDYFIGSNYYTSAKDADDPSNGSGMSAKNSIVIDVDMFNNICDELYIDALYRKTIFQLFCTDNYEHILYADAKIIKAVCNKVNNYISNNENASGCKHISQIKLDRIEPFPDDFKIEATFYIKEHTDIIKILTYHCKFKVYDWKSKLKELISEEEQEEIKGETKMKENNIGAKTHPVAPAPATTAKVVLPEIEKVYYNKTKKTVTVFWSNGTETKAITAEGDKFSLTTGIKECFIKYACGNNFDSVQNKLQDAKKKAVLTVSKEKSKKTKVERLAAEAANLTSDEKDELVKALTDAKNDEVKPAKRVPAKRPKRKADEIGGNN